MSRFDSRASQYLDGRYLDGRPTPAPSRLRFLAFVMAVVLAASVLSARLPAFAQLDVRVDRSWTRSWGTLKLFLDVQNVTNRLNPEGVTYNFDYSQVRYTRGLPVFPSLGLEYAP